MLSSPSPHPISIRQPPPYITRQPMHLANPTAFSPQQWRMIAREPITRLCIRHIVRELVALEWKINSKNPKDEQTLKKITTVFERSDEGDGWDAWLARMLEDSLVLPIGGNSEIVPDPMTGMIGALCHVDGATLYPTYEPDIPFVQINPYNTTERIYFVFGDLMRLLIQPRPELQRRPFQEAPVEAAFIGIEALSRIYVYYLKQLTDTPIMGVLDLMDMTQDEAAEWAKGFREMMDGIDPLKMPLLYDHTRPARFVPLGRSPQDINLIEQFKRFAEIVTAAFGLSIGDLRLFEHERVLAGVEASQRVTARSGVGFYAQAVEDMINRTILLSTQTGFSFKFILGMTGEDQQKTMLDQSRVSILTQLAGPSQALMKPEDAQAQLKAWGIVDVELHGIPQPPGLEGLGAIMGGGGGEAQTPAGGEETANDFESSVPGDAAMGKQAGDSYNSMYGGDDWYSKSLAGQMFAKKSLPFTDPLPLIDRAVKLIQGSFTQLSDTDTSVEDWWAMPDIASELTDVLRQAFDAAVMESMQSVQNRAYALQVANSYQPPVAVFKIVDPDVVTEIARHANDILTFIDEGTSYYLEKWENPDEAQKNLFNANSELCRARVTGIVTAELSWVRGFAQYALLKKSGFTKKVWVNGTKDVDNFSNSAAGIGAVDIDYEYASKFDNKVKFPPADTKTTSSRLIPTDEEIKEFYENRNVFWNGSDDNIEQSRPEGVLGSDPVEISDRAYQQTSILA